MSTAPDSRSNPQPLSPEHKVLQQLLQKIACADKQAFQDFYDRTIRLCFSLAHRITGKQECAEDVINEVYLQVWRTAASYDAQRSNPITWLMLLCRSRALDALRKYHTRISRECSQAMTSDRTPITDLGTDETPLSLLDTVQQHSQLHRALQQLKPAQRQILSLAYFKGLTQSEIANYTNTPLGTVKTHIRRAILTLREYLDAPLSDDASPLSSVYSPSTLIEDANDE